MMHVHAGPPPGRHMCFDVSTSHAHSPIVLYHCHGMQGNQLFKYNLVCFCFPPDVFEQVFQNYSLILQFVNTL